MTIKVRIKRPLFQAARPEYAARLYNFTPSPADRTFIDTLAECGGAATLSSLKHQHVSRTPSRVQPENETDVSFGDKPAKSSSKQAHDLLAKLFSWLRTRYAQRPVKKLRVSETVSLGEKRFVAILQVDDRKYLIGGGASNVALLASLDAQTPTITAPAEPEQTITGLRGIH